jgi:hypothetical protein
MYNSKQATGGDCKSSPGDKIHSAKARKPARIGLDNNGGSHNRGSGNKKG